MNRAYRMWCVGPDPGDEYACMPPPASYQHESYTLGCLVPQLEH